MSEQEITAEALERWADVRGEAGDRDQFAAKAYRRAARTIRRLEGEVAELKTLPPGEYVMLGRQVLTVDEANRRDADAELGSLVRRIREHPEARGQMHVAADVSALRGMLSDLDTLAQRRAAEEGERGPSGRRFRVEADGSLSAQWDSNDPWSKAARVDVVDVAFVAELLERVRKGVPRGE